MTASPKSTQTTKSRKTRTKATKSKPTRVARDDLKEIKGIGPALEKQLNKLGIRTYRQISKWAAAEINEVAEELGTSPAKIRREKWVASAKKLL